MPQQAAGNSQLPTAEFYALKTRLEAPGSGFIYTSRPVAGGTEFTYRHTDGTVLALAVPSSTSPPSSNLRAGGCGFLQLCIYFNRSDQRAIINGITAGLAAAICSRVPGAGCAYASAVLAIAASYLADHGICSNELRVRILPIPDLLSPACV
jgi:hypothetical protein